MQWAKSVHSGLGAYSVGGWSFDNITGNTVLDDSGNNNHGTIYGATQVDGVIGKALSFDGVDDYVSIADSQYLRPGTSDFTISFWIKIPFAYVDSWLGILVKGLTTAAPANTWGFLTRRAKTNIITYHQSSDAGGSWGVNMDTLPMSDGWHFITLSRENNVAKLYVDGVFHRQSSAANQNLSTPANIFIGRTATGSYFNRLIDDVRIYNVLSVILCYRFEYLNRTYSLLM